MRLTLRRHGLDTRRVSPRSLLALRSAAPAGALASTADAAPAKDPAPADTAGRFVFRSAWAGGESYRFAVWLPPGFERIHKSYVVRWSAVKALHAAEGSHYEAELRNGVRLPVGRTRYKELREKLG